ncbi:MAG: diguanylate cyclase [Desulfobacteraceae bacterium]|nr:diguanylate cyclase [Desulfobacteraceae bacterium]
MEELAEVFAEILKHNCRTEDFPARFGGEEFIAFLPHTPAARSSLSRGRTRLYTRSKGRGETDAHSNRGAGTEPDFRATHAADRGRGLPFYAYNPRSASMRSFRLSFSSAIDHRSRCLLRLYTGLPGAAAG